MVPIKSVTFDVRTTQVVSRVLSPSRHPPRGAAKPRARGPRMIGTALQEMVTSPLLPPEEGRVVNPLFPFLSVPPLGQQPAVPKFSIKEQFLSSPGPKRARRVVRGAKPLHSHPPLLSPADSSAQFEKVTQASPAPPVRPWSQVSVAQHTQSEYIQGQDSGPTETFSEAPGAYGSRSGSNPARFASYETASALASRPSPEMGVATRHVPSGNHSGIPPNLQPVVRPLVSSDRSAPRAGVLACCGLHGCLCHRLGCHVQWACSVRGVDGPPTALARQLPRIASSTPCPEPPERAVMGRACAGPYGQHCDCCVHQPSRGSALPSHVATHPPSPPLESEASEVALRHSCPWCAQPCGRRALTSCAAGRVATPSPGGPVDLGRVRRSSGRPVCFARNLSLPVVLLPVRGDALALYTLKWNLFVEWCSSHREDPRRCSIGVVLSFLQQGLERRLSPSTLKVHAAAISACHDHIDGKSVGKHDLVFRFLRGVRWLNPPRPPLHTLLGPCSGAWSTPDCSL